MRRSLFALLFVLAASLAACASDGGPAWTYAPPTEAPASVAPTPAPSGELPSEPPASEPAPSDGGGGGGDVVTVTASKIAWVETELTAPADTPFTLRFDNQDAGVPHDVVIKGTGGQDLFKGEIFPGAEVREYQVPAIPAGTYQFVCTVHPNMVGTITFGS